jgi:hypothetical protein
MEFSDIEILKYIQKSLFLSCFTVLESTLASSLTEQHNAERRSQTSVS